MSTINTWPGWECVGKIGEGAFGNVYKIQRVEFDKIYSAALKVITIPRTDAEIEDAYDEGMDKKSTSEYFKGMVENIASEFALMSEVKGHSNIVSYEDHKLVPHKDGIGWDILIRMELLTSLQKYCRETVLSERDIIQIGIDICSALEVCHERKIIHRDIKPENIFVSKFGNYKLGDFGISKTMEHTKSNMSRKGTYLYMAPEVYNGKEYSYTADIYSLATVLYRLLNENRMPFLKAGVVQYGEREEALIRKMKGEKIPEPMHGSAMLKRVILKALAYNPKERFQSAIQFKEALRQCMVSSKECKSDLGKEEIDKKVQYEDIQETETVFMPIEERGELVVTLKEKEQRVPKKKVKKRNVIVPMLLIVLLLTVIYVVSDVVKGLNQEESSMDTENNSSDLENGIPIEALQYNEHSYYIYNDTNIETWEEAKEFCEAKGGYLAVISSVEENAALYSYVKISGYSQVFFGFSDAEQEGEWKWVENETSDYTNWHINQPNGSINSNYAQFVEVYADGSTNFSGEWSDSSYGEDMGNAFICEWAMKIDSKN